jgi:hypothetical protein
MVFSGDSIPCLCQLHDPGKKDPYIRIFTAFPGTGWVKAQVKIILDS